MSEGYSYRDSAPGLLPPGRKYREGTSSVVGTRESEEHTANSSKILGAKMRPLTTVGVDPAADGDRRIGAIGVSQDVDEIKGQSQSRCSGSNVRE